MRQDVVERLPQIVAYLRIHGVREQDLQDIAHDTVVAACEAGDRLKPQRVPKRVRQTARRLVRRFWRRGRLEDPGHDIDARPTDAHNPESMLREKEIRDLLERLLDELAPEQRVVIKQACLDGRLLTEIAEEQGISYDTVRSRYQLGLEELDRQRRAAMFYAAGERKHVRWHAGATSLDGLTHSHIPDRWTGFSLKAEGRSSGLSVARP